MPNLRGNVPAATKDQTVDGQLVRSSLRVEIAELELVHRARKDPAMYIQFDAINVLLTRIFEVFQQSPKTLPTQNFDLWFMRPSSVMEAKHHTFRSPVLHCPCCVLIVALANLMVLFKQPIRASVCRPQPE